MIGDDDVLTCVAQMTVMKSLVGMHGLWSLEIVATGRQHRRLVVNGVWHESGRTALGVTSTRRIYCVRVHSINFSVPNVLLVKNVIWHQASASILQNFPVHPRKAFPSNFESIYS